MIDFSYVGQYLYTPPNGNQLTFNFSSIPEEYFTSTSHYQYLPVGRTTLVLPIKPNVTGVSEGRSSNFNWNGIISQYISNTRSNNFNWSGSTYNLFNISDTRLRYFNSSINTIKQYLPTIKTIAKEPSSRSNSFNWEREKPAPTYTYTNTLADPYFASVVLGMHMDGTDNGTTFTDITGKTVTRYGNTITKTGTKKFGTASAYFDGTTDYLGVTVSSPILSTTGPFTIDMWANLSSFAVQNGLFYHRTSDNIEGVIVNTSTLGDVFFRVANTNTAAWAVETAGPIQLTTGIWYHLAFVRDTSNNFRVYINGVMGTSVNWTGTIYFGGATPKCYIGASTNASWSTNGYLDDVRVTNGIARYTSNFTPPTLPFANNGTDTILVIPSYNLFNSSIDKTPSFNESRISYNLFNNSETKTAINTSGTRTINLTTPTRTLQFNSAKPETHCIRN